MDALPLYDHAEERVWRHLDSCQFFTYLHARPPRVVCPTHGVRQVRLPWAEARARFTALFERLAIDALTATDVRGATRILRISWDETWHILERAVARGRGRKGRHVPTRRPSSTSRMTANGRAWMATSRGSRPRFHIMQHVGNAVNDVRKREHRERRATGDEILTGSKYLWLYAAEHLPERHRERFAVLKALHLETGQAWAIKESLRELWAYVRLGWARRHWR